MNDTTSKAMIKQVLSAAFTLGVLCSLPLPVQGNAGYPGVFDTNQVLHLHLTMDPADFNTIRSDETFDIQVPAQFWTDGEVPLSVLIRRKSADSINGKVSYKIDVNDLVNGQKWNDLTKLSLENGDDQDVVSEGLAWYMHRVAASNLASYSPGMAAWTTLTINGESQGVYLHVEQVNKQFLRNRSLWDSENTWLFFQDDRGQAEYKEGPTAVSPTMAALDFAPFVSGQGSTPAPSGAELQTLLNDKINMQAMLTLGAVNAFTGNPDELFNHAKNFFWADFAPGTSIGNSGGKRMYFPWDLDSAIQGVSSSIYGQGTGPHPNQEPYQELILNDPVFRLQYNQIMLSLLNGPLSVESLTAFLNDIEPVLTPYLQADPNNRIGNDIAGHFDSLRNWVSVRHANVYQQVIAEIGNENIPGDYNRDGTVNAADYVRWRDTRGSTTNLAADGSGNGTVDTADYVFWRARFGQTAAAGAIAGLPSNTVPEPAPIALILLAAITIILIRSRGLIVSSRVLRIDRS